MSEHSKYQVRHVFDEAVSLFEQKNADYGDSWQKHGWRGNLGRILEKADRLQTTLWHNGPIGFAVSDEDARQTAIDMMNTLAFFVINWDHRREWGNEEPWVEFSPEVLEAVHTRHREAAASGEEGAQTTLITVPADQLREGLTPSPTPRPVRHSYEGGDEFVTRQEQ